MGYNDVDGLANNLIDAHLYGERIFDRAEGYRNVTIEQVNRAAQVLDEEFSALSVILPA